ncbi:DUF6074 family protein [Brucella intermedia GD04153]|uniref:DUF6074 family protein n=2 Tax=Brucella/Ochrobactrum group TaxID=2826938 RepID=A0AA42KUJ5_9HYPH|nr:DUF6074 family protein [Brucella intermedia]MDH0127060.1 DUF6074 family protein [Brucella intermedia GD04153]
MSSSDLPLFTWHQPVQIIVFPMDKRIGRIREVASKLLDKPSARAADHYRNQVSESLDRSLDRMGIAPADKQEHVSAFWNAVQSETTRMAYEGSRQNGGGAA